MIFKITGIDIQGEDGKNFFCPCLYKEDNHFYFYDDKTKNKIILAEEDKWLGGNIEKNTFDDTISYNNNIS